MDRKFEYTFFSKKLANKHMKKHWKSLIIREMQIKPQEISFHTSEWLLPRTTQIKKMLQRSFLCKDAEKKEPLTLVLCS